MRMDKGNKAIRDHAQSGKDLHLFEIVPRRKGVRYVGQMVCAGYEVVPDVPDRNGDLRQAIAFRLAPLETTTASPDIGPAVASEPPELQTMWVLPLEQLQAHADRRQRRTNTGAPDDLPAECGRADLCVAARERDM